MMPKTSELHFEDAIEHHLLLTHGGWSKGDKLDVRDRADYDLSMAVQEA
jgi:hypothetical protein